MPKPRKSDGSPSSQIKWEKNKAGSILVLMLLIIITIGITLMLIYNLSELIIVLSLSIVAALISNRILIRKEKKNHTGLFAWFVIYYVFFYIIINYTIIIIILN